MLISAPQIDMRSTRALQIAIVVSLAIHAAVLYLAPGFRAPPPLPQLPTLSAVLRNLPQAGELEPVAKSQASPEPEPARPPEPRTKPELPKPAPPKPEAPKPPAQATPVISTSSPTAAPSAPAVSAAPSVPSPAPAPSAAPEAKSAPASAPPAPPVSVASNAPTAASANPVDPSARTQYLMELSKSAGRYKVYPREAREHNWTGKTDLRLTIGENGHIRELVVETSSGYEVLDKSAIETIRKAVPLTEIKPELRNREFTIIVPYTFNIERPGG